MSWPKRIVSWSFNLLFFLVPLIFLPNTSELFEFNKIIVTWLVTVVVSAAWIARMIHEKKWIFKKSPLDIPLVLFLLVSLLSLAFSIDPHTSWYGYYSRWNGGLLSLFSYAILYWAFVANMDSKSTKGLLVWTMISASLVSAWGVLEHFGIDAHWWVQDVKTRVFSTLGQPNWLAAYLVALIFIPLSKLLNLQFTIKNLKRTEIVHFALFILLFATLLFTKSRSGLLAFGISSGIYWALQLGRLKGKIFSQIVAFSLVVLTLTLVIPNPLRDLVIKSSTPAPVGPALEVGGTESGSIRKIVWTGAISIWKENTKTLLLGSGPETFAMSYYKHRPLEHNQTSEWELLYNKAHNEFLNQLATTGLLGLISYLLMLGVMAYQILKSIKQNSEHFALRTGILAGWLTIPITNFWGFSVVIVQILMILLPAISVSLDEKEDNPPQSHGGIGPMLFFAIFCLGGLIIIGRYWLADVKLASAQKATKYFQATNEAQYLSLAYQEASGAFGFNKNEPVIASELSNAAAYLALAVSSQSTASAQALSEIAVASSDRAIKISPTHPNYYKSRARSFIILSDLNPEFLQGAAESLKAAMAISPTDPRLPFNLGVVHKYLEEDDKAKKMFEKALLLKPDFADPLKQLEEAN